MQTHKKLFTSNSTIAVAAKY